MSASFWLSFIAVAMLGLVVSQWVQGQGSWWQHCLNVIFAQLWLFVGLLPVLAIAGLPTSLLAPLVNLVAIPFVAVLVVPPLLTTMVVALINESKALWLLDYVSQPLLWLWHSLQWISSNSFLQPLLLNAHAMAFIIACAGLVIIFIARNKWQKLIGLIFVLSVFLPWPVSQVDRLRITILDVGQGLAVLVQTPSYVMLYDTGASYPSGFTLAEAVIAPQLHQLGIKKIDKLVVSHSDNDHAGGVDYVARLFTVNEVLTPIPGKLTTASEDCRAGQQWLWDEVTFEVLHPQQSLASKTNNQSCVLKITSGNTRVLLTGDIERVVEHQMVASYGTEIKADVLLTPHHGSATSSSPLFLEWVQPRIALNSSGYLNRFNHPATEVSLRYQRHGIPLVNTAISGSIVINWAKEPLDEMSHENQNSMLPLRLNLARSQYPRYWRSYPCEIPLGKQDLSFWQQFIYQQNCA